MRIPTLRHAVIEHGVDVAWSHDAVCEDAADDVLLQGEAFHRYTAETVWPQGRRQEGSIGANGQTKHDQTARHACCWRRKSPALRTSVTRVVNEALPALWPKPV